MLAPQGQRKRVPAGLRFAEPEGAPVLSCPSKWEAEQISMVRVISMEIAHQWLDSFCKYDGARP